MVTAHGKSPNERNAHALQGARLPKWARRRYRHINRSVAVAVASAARINATQPRREVTSAGYLYLLGTIAEGEVFVTKDEALVFTNRATNHLMSHALQVGMMQLRWATLVHDTLLFADGMKPDRVDEVLDHFLTLYCMLCAQAGVKPHHIDEAAWRRAIAELNKEN
jgi:hypothetical protein